MLSKTETVSDLFGYAIELERASEALYLKLGAMFTQHSEVERFWKRYAEEEAGHASYLERVRATVDPARLAGPADRDMLLMVRRCLKQTAQANLKDVKTLDDAHQLATELENSETNTVFEFMIMSFSTDELAKSQPFLRTQLNTHVARLDKDFPSGYRERIARQNVKAGK